MKPYAVLLLFSGTIAWTQPNPLSFDTYRTGIVHLGKVKKNEAQKDLKPTWIGTGFLVDTHCSFGTAKHVVDSLPDYDTLIVRIQNPNDKSHVTTHEAHVIYRDKDTDLAFIRVETVGNNPCASGPPHYAFKVGSTTPITSLTGEHVLIIGHPKLGPDDLDIPIVRTGIIASGEITLESKAPTLLLDLVGVPGFSGSPVILERTGEVVGIVYGPRTIERVYGFEFATPLTIDDFIRAMAPPK